MAAKLTTKQAEFVRQYLVDLNATQAAIRAGYSEKTAYRIGAELLQKTSVANAVATAQAKREQRTEITQDRVVAELAKIAFGSARDVMEWGPDGVILKDSAELTDDQAAGVAEVSESTTKDGGSLKLKRHDKVKALELLGRHLGMFTDKVKNEITGGIAITWQD
ncbi:MAG: terminase small subunit [Desulfovibrio sp.]|uniref:terminase small subunit n=1 Tax=Desulfovibrio sp. TaxID=885 RepID=UPI002A35FF07|nr:terminase small subunit [Desulfovibrio sp.]MDY0258495.1 terminase small subunit [Desulfovibrio sp.]